MLNLANFEQFCSKLKIQHRDTGQFVPFKFNPSQQTIMRKVREQQALKRHLWLIFLKSRRLGVSRWSTALALTHCMQKSNANAKLVAQLSETSRALFEQCLDFKNQLPFQLPKGTQTKLEFPHSGGVSTLSRATAKTVIGGRGLTHSFLHLSEAAFYPGQAAFVALLNTVSRNDPDNIVVVETTPNGMEGPGEAYYDYWNDAVAGRNDFLAVFLPWHEDPATLLPDELAPDAPADEYEKWLMSEFKVTRGQIAWYRQTLATMCNGSIHKWRAEYSAHPSEAFIATGEPVFDFAEMAAAEKMVRPPIEEQQLMGFDTPYLEERKGGPIRIWEHPIPGDRYYIGADAAKGVEDGDFASATCWNGDTGQLAWTYTQQVPPPFLAVLLNFMGRKYNKAMVNVEMTGGWGYMAIKDLRDRFSYPNQYWWRGRDERVDTRGRPIYGWETTDRSRRMLMDTFRSALHRRRFNLDGTIEKSGECPIITNKEIVAQMSKAQVDIGYRWRVMKGHDDELMGALLGWIAKEHYHIPRSEKRLGNNLTESHPENVTWTENPETTADGISRLNSSAHFKKVMSYKANKTDRLAGV